MQAVSSIRDYKEGNRGLVVSVDLEGMLLKFAKFSKEITIPKAITIQGDFTKAETKEKIKKVLEGNKVNVVISDMAPSTSGHRSLDHDRIMVRNRVHEFYT